MANGKWENLLVYLGTTREDEDIQEAKTKIYVQIIKKKNLYGHLVQHQ